ncbi:TonB-dependent receptor [Flavobacterium cupreum]|uniref:Outer membrane receptor protein involved in Fe transport n=2 Tax=Flavobacterium TaxID=237 RepID=A0A4Y7UED3_9FLAO|nr:MULTISPECIES: outer membrane beta-barrel family protein [Flavobacterium]RUT67912.1 TonB-dependent receptor [Flavobacterium cupreum]TCN59489.1 outer membrane receptor protein involved in Fe transport [Flavobacterium circumlabens]TEB44787.1 TonB-dependent receptor [Flavobacterium circumlabens]
MRNFKTNPKIWLFCSTITNSKYVLELVVFFILISVSSVKAQDLSVSGAVLTKEGKPLNYATVSLINAKDSALMETAFSDANGIYKFMPLKAGEYIVSVEAIGFNTKTSLPFLYALTQVVVDTITIEESSENLKEVVVTTSKPTIERKDNRMVINVAGSVLAAGNNAIDILERAPGVSVDRDGNISLNGKAGVTVMINDKLSYLSNSQLAGMLRSTNGNTIQAIEIMTNPSSKYDASGNSGIINIRLKKNKENGFNGSLILGVGHGHYVSDNASLSLNAKTGNLNSFANISRINDKKFINLSSDRIIDSSGFKTIYSQKSSIKDVAINNSYRIGADYETGKNNTLGIVINGYFNDKNIANKGIATIIDPLNKNLTKQISVSDDNRTLNNVGINLNDRFRLDTIGQALSIDLDYIKYKNNGDALLSTLYDNSEGNRQQQSPYYLRQNTSAAIVVHAGKADYISPDFKTVKIETGIKISEVKTDNTLEVLTSSDDVDYVFNPQLSNQFIYKERIQASYINLTKKRKQTTIQLGLRSEHTTSKGTLLNSNEPSITQKYLDFFPNLFVLQSLNAKNKISLNLSRRIERPNYQSLNPFAYYIDPYTRQLGNPFLKPQYTNNIELNYSYSRFDVGLSYAHTTNVSTETVVTDTISKISSVTFINLNSLERYTISTNYSYSLANWWSGNINGYLTYNNYNLNGSSGVNQENKNLSYNIKSTQNFRISNNYKLEINARYQSQFVYGLYHLRPFSSIDAGVSHSFWSDRANLKISVNDIFNERKTDLTLETKGSHIHGYQKNDTRLIRFVFTYNFGSKSLKSTSHLSSATDEKSRAGN